MSKEAIQEAVWAQQAIDKRKSKPRSPDFKPVDVSGVIPDAVKLTAFMTEEEAKIGACCRFCRKEIERLRIEIAGKVLRPLPICKCAADIYERERELQERRERKAEIQKTYRGNIMPEDLREARLANFLPRPGTEKAKEMAERFVRDWPRKTGLLLFGPVGNGKSHLARAIEYEIDKQEYPTLFLNWPLLTVMAKSTFNNHSKATLADILKGAVDADLLVMDELGAGALTEFEFADILFPIINGRQGKPTVFTTNLDIERLEKWLAKDAKGNPLDTDGRIIDRILGSCDVVRNKGTSKRREDARARMEG